MKRKENELTLKPLLLLVWVAAPKGKRGATNFFLLEGGGVGATDDCSLSKEEEEIPAFL
jgi:hypothetical protein